VTALQALRNGDLPDESMRERFARPVARIDAGRWLAANGATAAIDVSDGLLADLRHLALASNVCLDIDPARVPCMPGVSVQDALSSGEEYELAFTTPPGMDVAALASDTGVRASRIGTVESGTAAVQLRGVRVEFASGHDHFSH
jgi:thiamine-monophosphate kinase